MVKVWTKLEEQKQQAGLFQEKIQHYKNQVVEAQAKLESLQTDYDQKVDAELKNGVDHSVQKNQLRKDIRDAKDEVEFAEQEELKMLAHVQDEFNKVKITHEDLVMDYKDNFRPSVFEVEVKPLFDRLEQAKADYFNALFDIFDKGSEYESLSSEAREIAYKTPVNGAFQVVKSIVEFGDIPFIQDDEHRNAITNRVLPHSVKRVKL
jgi:chromosome segregation ATPase